MPIFHRPLYCHILRCQILTAVFHFPNKVLENAAVALLFADLRQPLLLISRCTESPGRREQEGVLS